LPVVRKFLFLQYLGTVLRPQILAGIKKPARRLVSHRCTEHSTTRLAAATAGRFVTIRLAWALAHFARAFGHGAATAAFARRFNGDRLLRRALREAGFMDKSPKLPSLLRQETQATRCLLVLLFRLYKFPGAAAKCA
jgi:hypothetical protein